MNRNEIKIFINEKQNIKSLKTLYGCTSPNSKYYNVCQDIQKETLFLPCETPLKHRIYYIQNDLFKRRLCECGCGKYPTIPVNKYIRGHGNSIQDVIDKKTQAYKEKYGVNNPSQDESIKQKKKLTYIKHFNSTHYFNSLEGKTNIKETMIEKYGIDNYFKMEHIKEAVKNRFKNSDGADLKKRIKETNLDTGFDKVLNRIKDKFIPLFNRSEYIGVCKKLYSFKCAACNSICYGDLGYDGFPRCYVCNPLICDRGTSDIEGNIQSFVSSIESNIRCRVRDLIYPFEIDIVAVDQKIGIEVDGLYWHSEENGKTKGYHIGKTQKCKVAGYDLIHIFEDEWNNKRKPVQNIIKNRLGKQKYLIDINRCDIKEVEDNIKTAFLLKYHLLGDCNNTKNIGFFLKNKLLLLICIDKIVEKKCEIVRIANMYNTHINGYEKILIDYIKNKYHHIKIIVKLDNRWDNIENFKLFEHPYSSYIIPPQPWFLKDGVRYPSSIFKYLSDNGLLVRYDKSLSDYENLKLNGYDCIWDCGYTTITKELKSSAPSTVPLSVLPHNSASIRFRDHLEYTYSMNSQLNEIVNIAAKRGDFTSTAFYNKSVLSLQPHYYETEKKMWLENKNDLRDKLLSNRLKYIGKNEYQINDKEVLRGFKISGIHIGFTHFNPLWIKAFIEKYDIKSIYDPTMGWGHRLLGAYNIKYIGNDLDIRTYEGCCAIVKNLGLKNKILYNKDSAFFTPLDEYESVFTCPPYYNTECYNGKTFKNLEDYTNWWDKTIKCSVKPSVKYFAYIINTEYKNILHDMCIRNNLELLEIIELGRKTNHFQRVEGTKVVKGEYLYVFKPK